MKALAYGILGLLLIAGLLGGCSSQPVSKTVLATEMSAHQTDGMADQPAPGLMVWYQVPFQARHLDDMRPPESFKSKAVQGKPIPILDHAFGTGTVFDSGASQKVGVLLEGFIRFERPGIYRLKVLSNDGVRVYLKGALMLNDPDVHADSWDVSGPITVIEPGWYPILVQFFQRKNTSALRLYWQVPEAPDFSIVPAEAYGH